MEILLLNQIEYFKENEVIQWPILTYLIIIFKFEYFQLYSNIYFIFSKKN